MQTHAQKHNARQDAIWERAKALKRQAQTPNSNKSAAREAGHEFERGEFGPTTHPICKHCGLSEAAITHDLYTRAIRGAEIALKAMTTQAQPKAGEPPTQAHTIQELAIRCDELEAYLSPTFASEIMKRQRELTETKAQRDELVAELEWITRCAKKTDAVGITWYAIADEHMDAARALVAKL